MRQLRYLGGRTNTTAALNLLRRTVFQTSAGDRPSAPNVAVLVANGESTLDGDRVSTEEAACRDAGIVMVVVAADRTMTDSVELKSIVSSPTANNYFTTPSLSALPNLKQSVLTATCNGMSLRLSSFQPFNAHCCHMATAINHSVLDRVKPSFVIFHIRAPWRSALSVRVPRCQKLQMT